MNASDSYYDWLAQCHRIDRWGILAQNFDPYRIRVLGLGVEQARASYGVPIDTWLKMAPKWSTT